ncbi:mandelate racemase/muconate lactonizing enzyme family protein [Natronolimnobius sp. AArcel1]|uniref:mandelate racemase/muconate lactonizing enzyme family protein n=1 Tax=Natronolimnobius sp. AArcel1 TaxID=1679093 RepID=UPI0013EAF272|nr:mandelate racemase/muconate lactonizing enzyme family protein [Natronolimnobius sp. AArcel1]NGM69912.1 mandelate racemase/muconate lactonizing enzyme family protein [Natronolimnobius sp. AArcel1]
MEHESAPRDVAITDIQTTTIGETFEWTLVRIYTDAGVTGTGEMVLGPKADAYLHEVKPIIIGKNPVDIDARCTELFDYLSYRGGINGIGVTAISGIDLALHDLAGKLLEVPAHQLLGGKHREDVRVYCDVHAGEHLHEADGEPDEDPYDPEAYAGAAEAVVDEGWDAIKFDLDSPDKHVQDPKNKHLNARAIDFRASIVEAVTERVGDRADIAFDCHWSWTGDTVRRLASAVEDYDVWWLEDTVPPENHDVQEYVTHNTDTTIAAGENIYRVEGARQLVENQGLDIIHPDVPKNGGMLETKKIANIAKAYYIPLALHNVASPVGTMASAHVGASASNFLALEYHARDVDWWDDVVEEDILEPGRIEVPDEPGLGVEVDLDVVAAHMKEGEELIDEA